MPHNDNGGLPDGDCNGDLPHGDRQAELGELLIAYHQQLIDQSRMEAAAAGDPHPSTEVPRAAPETPRERPALPSAIGAESSAEISDEFSAAFAESAAADPQLVDELVQLEDCLWQLEQFRREQSVAAVARDAAALGGGQNGNTPAVAGARGRIGRFEILQELGRGGLGVVFLAHDPVLHRHVALKVPRGDALLVRELRTRFQREAQAAARLTHPHIVPVYEIGAAGSYFYIASAYVAGQSLADWLRKQAEPTPIREAAALVAAMADAMQYAHAQGVLHRDLKPANVLLEPIAADADTGDESSLSVSLSGHVPKITDFGLAKLVDLRKDETRAGAILGTPAYMSPEQAEAKSAELSCATDIYSLGVILYELLVGRTPHRHDTDAATLLSVVFGKIAPPRGERPDVPPDLQAICLKCLEREPARRYSSAGELASDLRRFLRGEATRARPLTAMQRLGRWTTRNPVLASLAAALFVALVGIATVSTIAAVRIGSARDVARLAAATEHAAREKADEALAAKAVALENAREAERQTAIARGNAEVQAANAERQANNAKQQATNALQQAARAEQINRFLVDLFNTGDPLGFASLGFRNSDEVGAEVTLSDLLARGAAHVKRQLADQPLMLANMLDTLGGVYASQGRVAEAEPLVREAYQLRQAHEASPRDLATSRLNLGVVLRWQGDFAESARLLREALAAREQEFGRDSLEVAEASLALFITLWQHGIATDGGYGTRQEADELAQHAYKTREAILGLKHPDAALAKLLYALSRFNSGDAQGATTLLSEAAPAVADQEGGKPLLAAVNALIQAQILRSGGNRTAAAEIDRQQIPVLRKMLGQRHPFVLLLMFDLAGVLRDAGRFQEAYDAAREAVTLAGNVGHGSSPMLIKPLDELATMATELGEFTTAEQYLAQARGIDERFRNGGRQRSFALRLARLYVYAGRYAEAAELFAQHGVKVVMRNDQIYVEEGAPGTATFEDIVASVHGEAELLHAQGELRKAQDLLNALALWGRGKLIGVLGAWGWFHLMHIEFELDPNNDATKDMVADGSFVIAYPQTCWEPILAARERLHRGRVDEAAAIIRNVLAKQGTGGLPDTWNVGYAQCVLGQVLAAQGTLNEAEDSFKSGLATLRKTRGDHHWLTRYAATTLVDFYRANNRTEDAVPFEVLLEPARVEGGAVKSQE